MTLLSYIFIASASLITTPPFVQVEKSSVDTDAEQVLQELSPEQHKILQQQDEIGNLKLEIERLKAAEETYKLRQIYYKIMFLRPSLGTKLATDIAKAVYKYSNQHKVDSDLTLAIIRVESYFNPKALSNTGARGLTQCMPMWREVCGKNLYDIETSINCGLVVLTQYNELYKGNIKHAILAYNLGPANIEYMWKNKMTVPKTYLKDITRFFKDLKAVQEPFGSDPLPEGFITIK